MAIWIICFITNVFLALVMIVFGRIFVKKAPNNINHLFGYRTNMSMKNEETWKFAHEYFGKLWIRFGIAAIPVALMPMVLVVGKGEDIIGKTGEIVAFCELFLLMIPIIPTEKALRKNFDKDGNRK